MKVNIKRLVPSAVVPKYAKQGDAGLDLVATSYEYDPIQDNHIYGTGLAVEIPEGYVGLIFPRSSNRKTSAYLTNHVGVVDSGYRGELICTFKSRDANSMFKSYEIGDRVAQFMIIPYPSVEFVEVEELSETERGTGGHGSTGK